MKWIALGKSKIVVDVVRRGSWELVSITRIWRRFSIWYTLMIPDWVELWILVSWVESPGDWLWFKCLIGFHGEEIDDFQLNCSGLLYDQVFYHNRRLLYLPPPFSPRNTSPKNGLVHLQDTAVFDWSFSGQAQAPLLQPGKISFSSQNSTYFGTSVTRRSYIKQASTRENCTCHPKQPHSMHSRISQLSACSGTYGSSRSRKVRR